MVVKELYKCHHSSQNEDREHIEISESRISDTQSNVHGSWNRHLARGVGQQCSVEGFSFNNKSAACYVVGSCIYVYMHTPPPMLHYIMHA